MHARDEFRQLLKRLASGDRSAEEPLVELLYDLLTAVVKQSLADGTGVYGGPLLPIAAVAIEPQERIYFLAASARETRRVLVDCAGARIEGERPKT